MDRPLLSTRTALVLLLAVLTAVGTAVLSAATDGGLAESVLRGGAAFGLALPFFDRLVDGHDCPARCRTAHRASRRDERDGGDHA